MPELPEVETIARTLAPQIVGRVLSDVHLLHEKTLQHGKDLLPRLSAKDAPLTIARVFRRAKLLCLELVPCGTHDLGFNTSQLLMVFHLKMTGSFFLHPPASLPLKHTRIIIDLSEGERLFFDDVRSFGYCRLMLPEQLNDWPFWTALGPEPLELSCRELAEHLAKAFAKRTINIKAALLNQNIIAGIGNIYADESLFQAGISPLSKASSLDHKRLLALADALQHILRRAISECGSSIRNYRDALGNAGAFQNSFAVYGRKGELCRCCQSPLIGTRIAGRGTVYCPVCQPCLPEAIRSPGQLQK